MSPLCFVDCETTGLDPARHHIWELAIVRVDEDGEQEHTWQWWPDMSTADPNGLRIGRFYDRMEAVAPWSDLYLDGTRYVGDHSDEPVYYSLDRLAHNVAHLLDGAHMVGAVPNFDAAFLTRFLHEHGQALTCHYHLVDVEALAAGWVAAVVPGDSLRVERPDGSVNHINGRPPWKSEDLSRAVGVDPDQFDRHTALGDARWAQAIYGAVML